MIRPLSCPRWAVVFSGWLRAGPASRVVRQLQPPWIRLPSEIRVKRSAFAFRSTGVTSSRWCARWNSRLRRGKGGPSWRAPISTLDRLRRFFPRRTFWANRCMIGAMGKADVICCTACGWPGCWPLAARIEVRQQEVTWSDFRQPYRGSELERGEWRYDGFGPFAFDRQDYERLLVAQPVSRKEVPYETTGNTRLTEVFNLAFRRAANDRAAAGCSPSGVGPATIPPAPTEYADAEAAKAWMQGYNAGYRCGASDAELASVDIPGAHGLISGFDQHFLERYGFLKGPANHRRERGDSH
jgi:hypothetical protein